MDKSQIPPPQPHRSKPISKSSPSPKPNSSRRAVWDCNSALYDSFELTSFQRHLDSAITATSARSLSMPHRTDFRKDPAPAAKQISSASKISRSFQKIFRSVFFPTKSKATTKGNANSGEEKAKRGGGDLDSKLMENEKARWFVVYEDDDVVFGDRKEKGVALSTIAEVPEVEKKAGLKSPEISAVVRKTMSERFSAASVSNRVNLISSCA